MDDAKNFMNKNMSNLKDFMKEEKLTLNIPNKVKKVMAGGSIKVDVVEDIENNELEAPLVDGMNGDSE